MALWKVMAPRDLTPNIQKGFRMQVFSNSTGGPSRGEIEEALKRQGINDFNSLSYASPGNWEINKI